MISSLSKHGLSIPLFGVLLLYGIGIAYYGMFSRSLGFSSYCGGIQINQILLVNWNSLTLISYIFANLSGLLYILKMESDLEIFKNAQENSKEKVVAARNVVKSHNFSLTERIITYSLCILWWMLVPYFFIWGDAMVGTNMILGFFIAFLIYWLIKAKSYNVKWMLAAFSLMLILVHAVYSGYLDARKVLRENKHVLVNDGEKSFDAIYCGQDTEYMYLIANEGPTQLSKTVIKRLTWK